MEARMNQSEWLAKIEALSKKHSKPLLASNWYHTGSEFRIGKWLPLSQAPTPIDYRTVLSNEIVVDIDAKKWATCKEFGEVTLHYLKEHDIPYILGDSGGKGIHIHVWFEANVSDEFLPTLMKAKEKGFNMRQLRVRLWKYILKNAGFKLAHMGKGNILDDALVNWDDTSKGHTVRMFGGRKKRNVSELGSVDWAWKTVINDVPERKNRVTEPRNVKYPEELKIWLVPEGIIKRIVTSYLAKKESEMTRAPTVKKYEGLYTRLPCVQKLIKEGNEEGTRHDGAGTVALACALDSLANEKTLDILRGYKNACDDLGGVTSFSIRELKQWVEWYKKREGEIFWDERTCSLISNFEASKDVDCTDCPLKKQVNKEAIKFLAEGDIVGKIQEQLEHEIVNEKENRILLFLCYCSAYLDHRVHPKLSGISAIGKSFLINQVLNFIPNEDVLEKLTSASAKYFNYALTQNPDIPKIEKDGEMVPNINGKILVVQEFEGAQDAIITLRPLMSGDQDGLNVGIVDKGDDDVNKHKNMVAVGRPVFACASTNYELDKEFMTRVWQMELDDSPEQTKNIMKFEAEEDVNPGCHNAPKKEVINDAVRLLKKSITKVMNPYSILLARHMPVKREFVRLRRDFKKIKEFIKIVAWLNQYQRPKISIGDEDYILATLEDYNTVKKLIQPSFEMIFTGNKEVKELYKCCQSLVAHEDKVTSGNVASEMGWGTAKARKNLNMLDSKGFLLKEKPDRGRSYVYRLRSKKDVEFPELNMENLKEYYEEVKRKEENKEMPEGKIKLSKILERILD